MFFWLFALFYSMGQTSFQPINLTAKTRRDLLTRLFLRLRHVVYILWLLIGLSLMLTFNLIGFCDCFVNFFSFDTQSKRAPLKVIKIAVTTICLLVWITPAITLAPSDNVNLRWSKILTHLKHKQQVNPCLTLVEYKITSRRWIRNYRYLKFSVNNFFYYFNM